MYNVHVHVQVIYKLTDFGYAKQYDNSSVCTSLVGTVQYVVRDTMVSSNCRDRYQNNNNRVQYVVRDTMVNSNCRAPIQLTE